MGVSDSEAGERWPLVRAIAIAVLAASLSVMPDSDAVELAAQGGIPPCAPNCNTVGDRAWIDTDHDGIQDGGEPGLPDVVVSLFEADGNGNITNPVPIRQTTTDQLGHYRIEPPPNGIYVVRFDPPSGYSETSVYHGTLKDEGLSEWYDSDADRVTRATDHFLLDGIQDHGSWWDAGFVQSSCVELGDLLWRDVEVDGEYDQGVDTPLAGATVRLVEELIIGPSVAYGVIASSTTNTQGRYSFPCVFPGRRYSVIASDVGLLVPSPFYSPTPADVIDDDNNFLLEPDYRVSGSYRPVGSTNLFELNQSHPDPYLAVDGGFMCDMDSVDVAITIDTSGSMNGEIALVKEGALALVDRVLAGAGATTNKVAVVEFSDNASVPYPLGSDIDAAKAAISGLGTGGQTNHGDGIGKATIELAGWSAEAKIILLVSDGLANRPKPTSYAEEYAKSKANAAKQQGIRVLTLSIGKDAEELMEQLASTGDDVLVAQTASEFPGLFRKLVGRLCGAGTPFACTGDNYHEFDLTTGANQSGGREQSWKVVLPGDDPDDEQNDLQPYIVTPHSNWITISGSSWIAHNETASSGSPGALYHYVYPLELSGDPTEVHMELKARADDIIEGVYINDGYVKRSQGGQFNRGAINPPVDPDLFSAPDHRYRIKVKVRDAGAYMTGFDAFGSLRVCVPPAPPLPEEWTPDPSGCDIEVWDEWDQGEHEDYRDGIKKPNLPAIARNPNNENEMAFCMKLTIACWGGSLKIAPPQGRQCVGPTPLCGGQCGAGHYLIPHEQEFDLGARHYAAIYPSYPSNSYTGWPHPRSNGGQGSFRVYRSSDGAYGDEVFRNADTSAIEQLNEMERYESTCWLVLPSGPDTPCPIGGVPDPPPPGQIGCIKPLGGGGQLQWVKWQSETIEPQDCPQ